MQQRERTSKEVIKRWRAWNEEQVDRGKAPEPFFTRWLDAHFEEKCYTCETSCGDNCVREER